MAYQFQQPYLGLSAGLQTIHGASGGGAGVGGWVELGRTTLGSSGDDITVSSLADKRYYMILADHRNLSDVYPIRRFGNSTVDSGTNYAGRWSLNGGADGSGGNRNNMILEAGTGGLTNNAFGVSYIANLSAKEKLMIHHEVMGHTAGAGTAPKRAETVGKWANTSNVIDVIRDFDVNVDAFNTGAEIVVLGWDPADTHTTNFWEELASVELGGANANLSSGTITAKKYLWIQAFIKKTSASTEVTVQYNNDTGSNYARRKSNNGGADGTDVSQGKIDLEGGASSNTFFNMFVINNSANEKLGICNMIRVGTTGAGTAPNRTENVNKWANTSAQITEIDLNSVASTFASGSILKVWGSD